MLRALLIAALTVLWIAPAYAVGHPKNTVRCHIRTTAHACNLVPSCKWQAYPTWTKGHCKKIRPK